MICLAHFVVLFLTARRTLPNRGARHATQRPGSFAAAACARIGRSRVDLRSRLCGAQCAARARAYCSAPRANGSARRCECRRGARVCARARTIIVEATTSIGRDGRSNPSPRAVRVLHGVSLGSFVCAQFRQGRSQDCRDQAECCPQPRGRPSKVNSSCSCPVRGVSTETREECRQALSTALCRNIYKSSKIDEIREHNLSNA